MDISSEQCWLYAIGDAREKAGIKGHTKLSIEVIFLLDFLTYYYFIT